MLTVAVNFRTQRCLVDQPLSIHVEGVWTALRELGVGPLAEAGVLEDVFTNTHAPTACFFQERMQCDPAMVDCIWKSELNIDAFSLKLHLSEYFITATGKETEMREQEDIHPQACRRSQSSTENTACLPCIFQNCT